MLISSYIRNQRLITIFPDKIDEDKQNKYNLVKETERTKYRPRKLSIEYFEFDKTGRKIIILNFKII